MKKIILPLAALALVLVACKKDYSCNCVETTSVSAVYWDYDSSLYSNASSYTSDANNYTFKVKKKESEDKCKGYESSNTENDIYGSGFYGGDKTVSTKCTLTEK